MGSCDLAWGLQVPFLYLFEGFSSTPGADSHSQLVSLEEEGLWNPCPFSPMKECLTIFFQVLPNH